MKIGITGAYGFIGSALVRYASGRGAFDMVLCDAQGHKNRSCVQGFERYLFIDREEVERNPKSFPKVDALFHLGACTDTGVTDEAYVKRWNAEFSKKMWNLAAERKIPFIYASSAATYGDGSQGFSDDPKKIPHLQPLNLYGKSKQWFDLWVLEQAKTPPGWWGLKYFNVYGPDESHKGRMASPIWHGFHQIRSEGRLQLFRSHRPDVPDGEQKRDFIYVEDVAAVTFWCWAEKPPSGIYNCGTGNARSFLEVARALFSAMKKPEKIAWIDTPEKYRAAYQYYTCADLSRLRKAGWKKEFIPLEEGVRQYVDFLRERNEERNG